MMTKNITALFSTIDFSIHKLRLIAFVLLGLLPFPVMASTVDISRYSTESDRVTLRFRVFDNNNIPIEGLNRQDIQILSTDSQGNPVNSSTIKFDLVPPERQSQPDPAYVAILLDMSGSMQHNDSGGTKKITGAIQAIDKFIEQAKSNNIPVKISLVPFGYKGGNQCEHLYEVTQQTIAKNSPFYDITNDTLKSQLKELSGIPVCASTNLYQPLQAAASYLKNEFASITSNVNPEKTQPRLAVILLSDGYDSTKDEQIQNLKHFLQQSPSVTVHSLGYGESLSQLRDRAQCTILIPPNDQLTADTVSQYCRLPNQDIREFIIDENFLKNIATATGGIYKLSANANEIAKSLTDFLTTLREYELVYRQPGADRATIHQTKIQINSPSRGINKLTSSAETIRISNFHYQRISLLHRINILAFTTILASIGILTFIKWSHHLKQQAERNLQN